MALFETKKKTTKKAATPKKDTVSSARLEQVLKHPWMSEKALIATEKGVYVFAVPSDATKKEIAAAVEAIYKVTPKKVTVANLPGKVKMLRHRRGLGTRARRHKAYVHLKKGDTITFA